MTNDPELRAALLKIDLLLKRRQAFWEIPKALAMLAVGCGVFMGFVLAGITWLHPVGPAPQQITLHLDQPLVVKLQSEKSP